MTKKFISPATLGVLLLLAPLPLSGQPDSLRPHDNLVAERIPTIPPDIISTRFGETSQIHRVDNPGGARVPWSESEQMIRTTGKNGTPVWYLLANDEGRGFAKKKNQNFQFYSTVMFMKKFLLGDEAR